MSDDHKREAQTRAQRQNGSVEVRRGDRIEAGGGLIEQQDVAAERHRARDAGPLQHAPRQFPRHLRLRRAHFHLAQQQPRGQILFIQRQVGELIEWKAHILEHVQRTKQRAALVHHSQAALQSRSLPRTPVHDAPAADQDVPRHRPI